TPTVGWPWSSRRMNCTGQPFTPPPWLMCSKASSAASAIFLVIGAIEPVSGSTPPTFTGHDCADAAVAAKIAMRKTKILEQRRMRTLLRNSLIGGVARDNGLFADEAARAIEQHRDEREPDQDHLDRGALGGVARRHELRHRGAGGGPDSPDDERAEQRAPVVAAATDDQHRPDLEGDDRQEIKRADEADEGDVERAREAHQGRAEDKGLQP